MTTAAITPLSSDLLTVEHDGDGTPFYPAVLRNPHLINRIPTRMRDQVQSTNAAYIAHRIELLETGPAVPAAGPDPTPEFIELRAKTGELEERGILITVRQLRKLATLHRLPVRAVRSSRNVTRYLMAGADWDHLCRHIATDPS